MPKEDNTNKIYNLLDLVLFEYTFILKKKRKKKVNTTSSFALCFISNIDLCLRSTHLIRYTTYFMI
jgi:hypothetical protein